MSFEIYEVPQHSAPPQKPDDTLFTWILDHCRAIQSEGLQRMPAHNKLGALIHGIPFHCPSGIPEPLIVAALVREQMYSTQIVRNAILELRECVPPLLEPTDCDFIPLGSFCTRHSPQHEVYSYVKRHTSGHEWWWYVESNCGVYRAQIALKSDIPDPLRPDVKAALSRSIQ